LVVGTEDEAKADATFALLKPRYREEVPDPDLSLYRVGRCVIKESKGGGESTPLKR
jgi:hypothetical protein